MRHLAWGENLVETSLFCEQAWAGHNNSCREKPTFTSHHILVWLLLRRHWLCHFTSQTGKLKKTYASSLSEKKPLWLWENTCVTLIFAILPFAITFAMGKANAFSSQLRASQNHLRCNLKPKKVAVSQCNDINAESHLSRWQQVQKRSTLLTLRYRSEGAKVRALFLANCEGQSSGNGRWR